jgi:hypothetical protein
VKREVHHKSSIALAKTMANCPHIFLAINHAHQAAPESYQSESNPTSSRSILFPVTKVRVANGKLAGKKGYLLVRARKKNALGKKEKIRAREAYVL